MRVSGALCVGVLVRVCECACGRVRACARVLMCGCGF